MIIKPLPILFSSGSMEFYIYPVLLKEESELTLIDCGYPNELYKLEEAFASIGEDMSNLKNVLITHHDHDHMGGLKELVTKYPKVKVYASEAQVPYLKGQKKSLRLEQLERIHAPKDFLDMVRSVEYIEEVTPISDHQMLPIGEGVTVLQTDGHMPGHLSFYVGENHTLITGDALVCEDGELKIADPAFVLDGEQEIESLKKLLHYQIDTMVCYHGGVYQSENLSEEIARVAEMGYSVEKRACS